MANLIRTAYLTRKIVKYGAFLLVFILVSRLVWGISVSLFRKIKPPTPPGPTVSFGKLPAIKFPEKKELPQLSFTLETIQAVLPKLEEIGIVYFAPKGRARLFSTEETVTLARRMGFTGQPRNLTPTKLFFETGQVPNTTLTIDIVTNNFELNYDFINDQQILAEKKLPSDAQAVSEAKSFLSRAGLLTSDLAQGEAKVSYFQLRIPELIPAISLSEADFIRIDLFRKNFNNLKVLPPHPRESSVFFLLSGSRIQAKRIVKAHYTHFPVDENFSATYPLKSSNTAWQELVAGQGYIANLGNNPEGKIVIRRVSLAYFEPDEAQNFLQPIFVFEGDNDFYAYVPAIDPKWLE